MRNLVQDGLVVPLTAPADVAPGALVNVGDLVGVAVGAAVAGATVQTRLEGVFSSLPITGSPEEGAALYLNTSSGSLTESDNGGSYPRAGTHLGKGLVRLVN